MSNNLDLDQVAGNQNQKEVTINDANGQIDAAVTERFEVDVTSGNVTITADEYRDAVYYDVTNATVAGREVTLQAIKRLVVISSSEDATQSIDVILGTTTITIPATEKRLVYTDGTANGLFEIGGGGGGGFDNSIVTDKFTIDIDNTNAGTVAVSDIDDTGVIQVDPDGGSAPTAAITLTFTAFQRGAFVVFNNTSFNVTCTISGQSLTAPVVPPGQEFVLTMDTSNVQLAGTPNTTKVYDFYATVVVPTAVLLAYYVVTENLTLLAGAPNSQAWVFANDPVNAITHQLQINEVQIGTINFAAGANVGTYTVATTQNMVPGDRIAVFTDPGPNTQMFTSMAVELLRR